MLAATDSQTFTGFDSLPLVAQQALYAWSHDNGDEVVAHHRAVAYTYRIEHVPTSTLTAAIMANPDVAGDGHLDFAAYHAWYLSLGRIPEHTERWPVIASGDEYVLDDGWHRFHAYVRAGDRTIAVLHVQAPHD